MKEEENSMSLLIGLLYFVEIVVCFLLGGVILLQKPKEGGLGVSFGGGMGEALFGAQVGNVLVKVTVILGFIFLTNTMILSRLTSTGANTVMQGVTTPPPATSQSALPLPGAPAAGGAATQAPAPAPAAAK